MVGGIKFPIGIFGGDFAEKILEEIHGSGVILLKINNSHPQDSDYTLKYKKKNCNLSRK
jgi:hypothetical protein